MWLTHKNQSMFLISHHPAFIGIDGWSGALKLQNERGSTKQRKDLSLHKKEKTNKKRPRDENDKPYSLEHKDKKRRNDEKKTTKFNESCHKARKDDSEYLEKSDLSEEHNPPSFVINQCSSLQSSKKNGVQDSDPNKKKQGMVIRIKLPLKKHTDLELISTSTDPCSSSQDLKSSKIHAVFTKSVFQPNETSVAKQPIFTNEEPCFSGRVDTVPIPQIQDCIDGEAGPSKNRHKKHRHENSAQKSERLFRELIVNWKPPSLPLNEPADDEDLDWLFSSRCQPKDAIASAPISKASISEATTCRIPTNSLQPRACYLPEYDMYQLPYVIPFWCSKFVCIIQIWSWVHTADSAVSSFRILYSII